MGNRIVLYIGGFELPDRNAAAQRVIGIAKGLRVLGYNTVFLNSIRDFEENGVRKKEYLGFRCIEYKRESNQDYLVTARTVRAFIKDIKPSVVFAYNYPGIALNRIRKSCKRKGIKCFADVTEWYKVDDGSILYRLVKTFDTEFRMRFVQKRMDGVVAISRFLYDYYINSVATVMIPPTVDLSDDKWSYKKETSSEEISLIYAGSPSMQKERLDYIVKTIEELETKSKIRFRIVGITEEQYRSAYGWKGCISDRVLFCGHVDHTEVLRLIINSDWSVIIRDNNFVVKAGFPTKLVESISCGTPVIVNEFSNVMDYLNTDNSVIVDNMDVLGTCIERACELKLKPDSRLFDYHNYIDRLKRMIEQG